MSYLNHSLKMKSKPEVELNQETNVISDNIYPKALTLEDYLNELEF